MNEIEKMNLAIEIGWKCNPETGEIWSSKGNTLKTHSDGYIRCSVCVNSKQFIFMGHRFVWFVKYGKLPENQLDHINGNRSDNRITNLRDVTNQENHHNRTKAKGYSWHKNTGKWRAQIAVNSKNIHLGLFETENEAHNAYLEAKKYITNFKK